MTGGEAARGRLHHVEVWVPDLAGARARWGWLLGALGYEPFQDWEDGVSYRLGPTYLVFEQSPALITGPHERCRAGLNHLAFHAGSRADVDHLVEQAGDHGWRLLFADRHPRAGGPDHYAAYLEDADGFEVELVGE
jgi:catechol 2,3-dioxygenase-like lactoylglutathione lyase family enzyme